MNTIASLFLALFLLGSPSQQAQDAIILAPSSHTADIDPLLLHDLTTWLDDMRPGGTNIYAVMNYSNNSNGVFVSLAGLDPSTPSPYDWQIENGDGESNVIWTGSLIRRAGELQLFTVPDGPVAKLNSMLASGPGGGVDIAFPWASGTKMQYGVLGVHGGGFSFGIGLDFIGGNDMGAGVATDTVYASAAGTITAVCRDDTSVGIKIEGGGNNIAYFHLMDNTSLAEGTTYARGAAIGTLRHGTFNDTCGYADQLPNHYHVHWVVEPAAGKFLAEGYQLNTTTQIWSRGNETIKTGGWIQGGAGTGNTPGGGLIIIPGGGSSGGGASLWDFLVIGINSMYGTFKQWYLPGTVVQNSQNEQMWTMTANMIRTMIRDGNVYLVNDALNILPFVIAYSVMLFLEAIKWVAMGVFVVFNLVKDIKGLALTS